MQAQRALDDLGLVPHTGVVQAGARAAQLSGWAPQQHAGQGCSGRGVANAHLATDEQLRTLFGSAQGAVATCLQGGLQLARGHRWLAGEVGSTGTQAQMAHAGQLQMRVDGTQVDDLQAGLQLARQHADRRTTADEVVQHLPGHRLRVGRDALFDHAVVAGKMLIATRSRVGRSQPCRPASWMARPSSWPSEPAGLVSCC